MRWVCDGMLRYLQFPMLAELHGFRHGIFTRFSVAQDGRKKPFNIGRGGPFLENETLSNRRRMIRATGFPTAVYARQVHGADVATWTADAVPSTFDETASADLQGDALLTRATGTGLVIQTADCQSVMLADPVARVVANVHAGWRGSIQNILERTVQTMKQRFGCRPEHLICGIGPSLGPCCAEFIHFRREIPKSYWVYRREGDRFDFWRMSTDQLVKTGVKRRNITVSGLCTRCNPQLFFSYRGQGRSAGRFAAVIGLTS
ncbi:MAG: peptidoglycan editing factor PgeF [Desulfatitalea sp.]|nr:peptidoglycan editing factor PgeF [Desulfatitalea sp.]NNK00955.1 peptidoglycan editing factor PgeF [Desulfatitalea sp.]